MAWIRFLTKISQTQKDEFEDSAFIARLAYLAEVEDFAESGGKMDQSAVATGGVLMLNFSETVTLENFSPPLGTFVLGDSGQRL